ncbi:MAG: hypothetical protein NVSMB40_19660 [Aquirhabdus sp.]
MHPDDQRVCIALFDQDKEGIEHFQKLSKNFTKYKGIGSIKKHVNELSFAMLRPAPDFRQDYVAAENHMIEFMFSDSALTTKVEGKGLSFKKITPQIIINGKPVDSQLDFFNKDLMVTFTAYRKIHEGKDYFSEKIVPTFPKDEFSHFNILFNQLESIPNFSS